ncbi:MAG: ABC-F family ATP-binding cassette domain-containing protein [Verrucomicrobiota bacterium]|jgi:ATP-binding cassette subfamily F protein 3|nr:ABC-F family ATP-binding cassette domain-containing protein [Verrucomicrobiota bacterium]
MIEFTQVSKRYGGQIVLDRVDFRFSAGERVGIVGPNGAGKSTLFDLIVGESEVDSGSIFRLKNVRIGYLRQQLPVGQEAVPIQAFVESAAPDLEDIHGEIQRIEAELADGSSQEESRVLLRRLGELQTQFEHQGGYGLHARAAMALSGLGFHPADLQRPLGEFSGGWQMRAELARALIGEPDLLLLDEPSNYLDLPAVEWLRRRLEAFRGTLAMISHDRYLLESLCQVTMEVACGRVTRYPGRYSWYAAEREKRREVSLAHQANEMRRRAQLERFVDRFRYKSTLSTRVQSKIKMLEKMETTEVLAVARGKGSFRLASPPHCGQEVLRCDDVGFAYVGRQWIFQHVDMVVQKGETLAVVGPNGAGKTTLLRMLAGQLVPGEGKRRTGHQVLPGYQSQELADTMAPTWSCFETLRAAAPDATESEIRNLLGGFGFSGKAIEKRVAILSGGERIRLAFARMLIRPPNLLLLDEPTTHLDVESREALQEAMRAYAGTVVLVSHDVEFVRAVAEGIIAVAPAGGGIRRFSGGYDYFLEKTVQENRSGPDVQTPELATKARGEALQDRKTIKADLRKTEKKLHHIEKEVAALEEEQSILHDRLAAVESSPEQRAEAGRRLKQVEEQLEVFLKAWEEAETAVAALSARMG